MTTSIVIILVSGVLLIISSVLFTIEGNNGRRLFLATSRGKLDIWLYQTEKRLWQLCRHFGYGSLRIALHFVLHNTLGFILRTIHFLEAKLHILRLQNKKIAKSVTEARKGQGQGHLSEIAEHKETVALSEEQKAELRNKSLHQQ